MTTQSNKRRFKRVDYTIKVFLETGDSRQTYLETRDINMRGIFVETEAPLPVGASGKLTIHLQFGSQNEEVHAAFKVVRSQKASAEQPAGMGLEFTEIDSDSSITLFNMVKAHGGFDDI